MIVTLLAAPQLQSVIPDTKLGYRDERGYLPPGGGVPPRQADTLMEFAGRLCYESWEKKNPATRDVFDYLGNIIAQGHWSILEHVSATLFVEQVSHPFLWEISRHRHLSFSVVSSRYTEPPDTFVVPPAIEGDDELEGLLTTVWEEAREIYDQLVAKLAAKGLKRKQIREAARAVLPYMTSVDMVITANLRAWIEVITKRLSVAADAEIRAFANSAVTELRKVSPTVLHHTFGPVQENTE